jgi:biopolymer transport protein ExbD
VKRKKRNADASATEMDLTPMIDVTFLLLIFFLLGTKFKEPEGKLIAFLPKDKGPPPKNIVVIEEEEELVIRVRVAQGAITKGYQIGNNNPLRSIAELEARLVSMYAGNSEQPVTIDADAEATHERVMWVLDTCVKVGYKEIAFAAAIPKEKQLPGAPRAAW